MRPPRLSTTVAAELGKLTCDYAFYYRPRRGAEAISMQRGGLFLAASLIKVPILFAWAHLERAGEVRRDELCELDLEPPVGGAGISWLLQAKRLTFADVLLMMIALSDNRCTNLVIRRIGLERLNALLRGPLRLPDAVVQRKLMDYEARSRGLENRMSPADASRLYELRDALSPEERAWIEPMLLANDDLGLLLRDIPRDTLAFWHKTGSIPGVLHDWGYTEKADIFLMTGSVTDARRTAEVFGRLGRLLLPN